MSDFHFRLFGFPVTIQPVFWLTAALLSAMICDRIENMSNANMSDWIGKMLIVMSAILVSILVHELGHGLAYRYIVRVESSLIVHGFGGLTVPVHQHHRRRGFIGMVQESFLAFAGPFAGFILAAAVLLMFYIMPPVPDHSPAAPLFRFWLDTIFFISVVWGIFNLLPIFPMDGGFILREVFSYIFPRSGEKNTYIFSLTLSVVLAAVSLLYNEFYITVLFALFAYQNYQRLTFMSFRHW
ncbi:MAG: M50 family metallopeptidase [Planctomycetaceae bacterium]|jgi:Zn-dependent protease|nr:M50 family metallopeptidase [Planctomycetaceae bacterium]